MLGRSIKVKKLGAWSQMLLNRNEVSLFSEVRSYVKYEVDVLGSPSPVVRTDSVDIKQV